MRSITQATSRATCSWQGDDTFDSPNGFYDGQIDCGPGNDIVSIGAGTAVIDGGYGSDTVVFSGPVSAYDLQYDGSKLVVTSAGRKDTLLHVENVVFSDANLHLPAEPAS
jgi:hypothetical protein